MFKAPGEKLGMSIKGGARSVPGNPLDSTDEGVFVSQVRQNHYNCVIIQRGH